MRCSTICFLLIPLCERIICLKNWLFLLSIWAFCLSGAANGIFTFSHSDRTLEACIGSERLKIEWKQCVVHYGLKTVVVDWMGFGSMMAVGSLFYYNIWGKVLSSLLESIYLTYFKSRCLEWLLNNLMTHQSVELLKELRY